MDTHGLHPRRPVAEIQLLEVRDRGSSLGSFDDLIRRVEHRHLVDAALVCLSSEPQDLARLDVVALPGPERDADLAALVPDHDRPRRLATFGDVFYLADSAFNSGTASGITLSTGITAAERSGCS